MKIAYTRRAAVQVGLALLVLCGALEGGLPVAAADEPRIPEQVAEYFASALIPRLVDLYGAGGGSQIGIEFGDDTRIGDITRVLAWTADFRAGRSTDKPVELTNSWVAPLTTVGEEPAAKGEASDEAVQQLGLATVWISPHTNLPELATFLPSVELGPALAAAPEGSMLVHDPERDSWFAILGDQLTTLSPATSETATISLLEAQGTLWQELPTAAAPSSNSGVVVAGVVLGSAVVILTIFVFVPGRKRNDLLDSEVALGSSLAEANDPKRVP